MPDLTITAPTITAGIPDPSVTLELTRDGSAVALSGVTSQVLDDVSGSVIGGQILAAAAGEYVATWTADNGVGTPAVITRTATIAAPSFSAEEIEGTYVFNGSGDVTMTLTAPAEYAGTFTLDQSEENKGNPLNIDYAEDTAPQAVVAGAISRFAGLGSETNHYPGTEYSYTPALWHRDSSRAFSVAHEWYEDGIATGYTGPRYSRAGIGNVDVLETITVDGQSLRTVRSAAIAGEEATTLTTMFAAPDAALLIDFVDAAGRTWTKHSSVRSPEIHNNYLRRMYSLNNRYAAITNDDLPADQEAHGLFRLPQTLASADEWKSRLIGVGARMVQGSEVSDISGYTARLDNVSGTLRWALSAIGGTFWTSEPLALADLAGREFDIGVRTVGDQISFLLDGAVLHTFTDATYANGKPGLWMQNADASGDLLLDQGLYGFYSKEAA